MKRYLLFVVACISCKAAHPTAGVYDKNYDILNVLTKSLVEAHESDTKGSYIYLRKDASNGHFKSILERNFNEYFYDEEYNLIFKSGDLDYMKKQLDRPYNFDISKIRSRKVKAYKSDLDANEPAAGPINNKPIKKLTEKVNYAFSRPVFTQNEDWVMVYVINGSGISVDILKKEQGEWEFYRMIPIGIF